METLQARTPLTVAACADPSDDANLLKAAARLSVDLNLPFLEKPVKKGVDALLVATLDRLELRMIGGDPVARGGRAVAVDFSALDVTSAAGKRLKQPLAKALGLKSLKDAPPVVIDCTAGWGEDSFLMAALGCPVLAIERNKIVATLLRDGLLRAAAEHPAVAFRIHLVQTNALHLLRRIAPREHQPDRVVRTTPASAERHRPVGTVLPAESTDDLPAEMQSFLHPDVIYLDPMFPIRKKGAEGKPMKVLRQLVGDDDDAPALLAAALAVAKKRVIVKRPLKGDTLTEREPEVTFEGKAMRYDVYISSGRAA